MMRSASHGVAAATFEAERPWSAVAAPAQRNAMTCDVEDYFQVSAFEGLIPYSRWSDFECRIPCNVDRLLKLFDDAGVKGTFFTLGWVAECLPAVVRRIAEQGHEVASHGMRHQRVWNQAPAEFRDDAARAKKLLEDVSGSEVRGYRAASWSFDSRTPWAHSVLADVGYSYSSSLYPISHDHYGVPDAPTSAFFERTSGLLEIPASTVRLFGKNWPASGGGYFRLLPLPVSLWLLRRACRDRPALFYFHPWEIDSGQPRVAGVSGRARFRHYLNLDKFERRFTELLRSFAWDRVDRVFLGDAARHAEPS